MKRKCRVRGLAGKRALLTNDKTFIIIFESCLYELVANDPAYREMEADTYDIIAQYTKTNELMQIKEYGKKEGKVDMCRAIAELIERGRRQGMEQGIEQGITQGIEQVIRAMIETSCELGSTKEETVGRIIEKIQISDDEAEMYVGKYWNNIINC